MSEPKDATDSTTPIEEYTCIPSADKVIALCLSPDDYDLGDCIAIKEPRGETREYVVARKKVLDLDSSHVVFSNKESKTAVSVSSLMDLLNVLETMQGGWPLVVRHSVEDLSHVLQDYRVYIAKGATVDNPRLVFVFPTEYCRLFGIVAPTVVEGEEEGEEGAAWRCNCDVRGR